MSELMEWTLTRRTMALVATVVVGCAAACAVNPATGKRQLALIGEEQEIEIGRQAHEQIVATLGLYDDRGLQDYVQSVGARLAAESERPELPWTFRVVDDPGINAFALPGGFIYVTRGILAHLNSEAELASVLGHEIGHVTARHGVNQMSKAQLAALGLGVGATVSEEFRDYAGLAETGLSLLFLKYSRDDERQADELGLRYVNMEGYDARKMAEVFRVLDRQSRQSDAGRVPGWLSTHPAPARRAEDILARIDASGVDYGGAAVRQAAYYGSIDGIVFGSDPRNGYFRDSTFLHPGFRFQMEFPAGYRTQNLAQAVVATSAEGDAAIELTLDDASSAGAALDEFFARSGATPGGEWVPSIAGMTTSARRFTATSRSGDIRGLVAFVEYDGRVYRLLGYATAAAWPARNDAVAGSLTSFDRLTDPGAIDVHPDRVRVVETDRALSLATFAARYDAAVDVTTLALINHLAEDARLAAGEPYKVVVARSA